MTLEETFHKLVDALAHSKLKFAFMGALGAIAWGRARSTTDLDVVASVSESSFEALRIDLLARGFVEGSGVGPAEPDDALRDIAQFWLGEAPPKR